MEMMDTNKTISFLERIILFECKKQYTDIDVDLVAECVDFLLELEGTTINIEKMEKAKDELVVSMKHNHFIGDDNMVTFE